MFLPILIALAISISPTLGARAVFGYRPSSPVYPLLQYLLVYALVISVRSRIRRRRSPEPAAAPPAIPQSPTATRWARNIYVAAIACGPPPPRVNRPDITTTERASRILLLP